MKASLETSSKWAQLSKRPWSICFLVSGSDTSQAGRMGRVLSPGSVPLSRASWFMSFPAYLFPLSPSSVHGAKPWSQTPRLPLLALDRSWTWLEAGSYLHTAMLSHRAVGFPPFPLHPLFGFTSQHCSFFPTQEWPHAQESIWQKRAQGFLRFKGPEKTILHLHVCCWWQRQQLNLSLCDL